MKAIDGGWTIGTMLVAQSGVPFTVSTDANYSAGGDYNADGTNYDIPDARSGIRTSGWTNSDYINGIFKTSDFTAPAGYKTTAVEGNQSRNMFRGPNYRSFDASLMKQTTLPWFKDQHSTLTFRVEAFNMINRVNVSTPNVNFAGSNFGKWTNTLQARTVQLGARFEY